MSGMGLEFTIVMTWGRSILLSLGKKRPKNQILKLAIKRSQKANI